MREAVSENVEGEAYVFDFLDTDVAVETFTELFDLAAPTLGALLSSVKELRPEDMDKEAGQVLDLQAVAQQLATSLQPKTVSRLLRTLCSSVMVSGLGKLEGGSYERHFKGRPELAITIAIRAFKVNGLIAA